MRTGDEGAQETPSDFYHLEYIENYLNRPHFFITGLDLRMFSLMGDRLAVSIAKALHPIRQVDETTLRLILAALRSSMKDAEIESDRVPAVSVCLLEALAARAASADQKEEILATVTLIADGTAGGEPR